MRPGGAARAGDGGSPLGGPPRRAGRLSHRLFSRPAGGRKGAEGVPLRRAGEEIVLGHSVERLCAEAAHYDAAFAERARRWAILDGFYVPTRYPNSIPDTIPARVYTADAAGEAVRLAREIVAYVAERFAP